MEKNDVDAGVLATGCGWSCGLGCGLILILVVLVAALGLQKITGGSGVLFLLLSFVGGAALSVFVGYQTAKAAIAKGVAPNLHVIILGVIFMVVGLLNFVTPNQSVGSDLTPFFALMKIVSWIATLPLMLFGANLARQESSSR